MPQIPGLQTDESSTVLPRLLGGAAALGTYGLSRKVNLSKIPTLRKIQEAAKGKLTVVDYARNNPAVIAGNEWAPEWLRKKFVQIARGADDVIQHMPSYEEIGNYNYKIRQPILAGKKAKLPKPVQRTDGAVLNTGAPYMTSMYPGDVNLAGDVRKVIELGDDKLREANVLHQYMPNAGPVPLGTVKDYLKKRRTPGAALQQLQAVLAAKAGKPGYIIKPRNAFATGEVIADTDNLQALRASKSQKSDWIDDMLENPEDYVVQQKLPIEMEKVLPFGKYKNRGMMPAEYRIHVVGGQIVPGATSRRYATVGSLNPFKDYKAKRDIAAQLQPELDKLPDDLKNNLLMGADVVRLQNGKYKIIETNPGGQSGFLAPDEIHAGWATPHNFYKHVTGRHSKSMSAARGLAAGGLTAGSAALLEPAVSDALD